jgi:hypothetical protein
MAFVGQNDGSSFKVGEICLAAWKGYFKIVDIEKHFLEPHHFRYNPDGTPHEYCWNSRRGWQVGDEINPHIQVVRVADVNFRFAKKKGKPRVCDPYYIKVLTKADIQALSDIAIANYEKLKELAPE